MLFGSAANQSNKRPADEEDPYGFDFGNGMQNQTGGFAFGQGASSFKPHTASLRQAPTTAFGGIGRGGGRLNTGQAGGRLMTAGQYAPLGTAVGGGGTPQDQGGLGARPMTSVSGAGYNSGGRSSGGQRPFDPLGQVSRGAAPPLAETKDNSPEDLAREMEKQVHRLMEASAEALVKKDVVTGLEKAKEAGKKERALCRHRETNGLADHINLDLTYAVSLNLAYAFQANHMHEEALHTYQLIVKNKQYQQAGRLRVNMGNIYYEQKKYPNAIKMYRMALDQVPNTSKELRFKIFRNIGNSFVRLGQFQDAIQSFETVMQGSPDFQTGFNVVLCYYALGDAEKMKRGFTRLLSIPVPGMEDEDEELLEEEAKEKQEADRVVQDRPDALKVEMKRRQKEAAMYILNAAKLISPVIDPKDWSAGFKWVVDTLKVEHEHLASQMEIERALYFLRDKQFDKAVEVLKSFEKKDQHLKAMAATNLSFMYFLENDFTQAEKNADLAIKHDRYNAKALVNKGNCLMIKGELVKARELYLEAIGVEADCVEAIFNLGLVNIKLNQLADAQQAYEKLHTILPNSPEVLSQIGNLCDMQGNLRNAVKWYSILITRIATDPGALCRLGQIYNKEQDESQAFHYHLESYRYSPVNLDVISWLGVWYVKSELYEKAIHFFERASQIQPNEVKWRLMVTSCYRRMQNYQKALELYEQIHQEYPENVECLRYLVAICKDLGRPYDQYQQLLSKLDRGPSANRGGVTQAAPQTPQSQAAPNTSQREEEGPAAPPPQPRGGGKSSSSSMGGGPPHSGAMARAPDRGGAPSDARDREEEDFGDADVNELLV